MKLRDFIEHHDPGKRPIGKLEVPWNKTIKNRDSRLPPIPKVTLFQKVSYFVGGMQSHHWLFLGIAAAMTSVVGVSFINGIFTAIDNYKNPKPKEPWRYMSFVEFRKIYDGRCRLPPEEMYKLTERSKDSK